MCKTLEGEAVRGGKGKPFSSPNFFVQLVLFLGH